MELTKENVKLVSETLRDLKVESGLSQEHQVVLMVKLLTENVFTDATPEQMQQSFALLYPLANASAFRQKMEKQDDPCRQGKKVLAATEVKKGATAADIFTKHMAVLGVKPAVTPTPES